MREIGVLKMAVKLTTLLIFDRTRLQKFNHLRASLLTTILHSDRMDSVDLLSLENFESSTLFDAELNPSQRLDTSRLRFSIHAF